MVLLGAHLESVLENEIAEHLAASGWLYSPTDAGYDRELALFPEDVLDWLKGSSRPGLRRWFAPTTPRRSVMQRVAAS